MKADSRRGVLIFALAFLALSLETARAEEQQPGSGTIMSTVIPAAQVFSCGVGLTFTSFGITTHGTLISFESPAGQEHINVGSLRSGYQICYTPPGFAAEIAVYDFSNSEGGWSAVVSTSQPNGPNTFPLEITRTSADGRIRVLRRITGNSFVGPVPVGNATYDQVAGGAFPGEFDGQGCSSMAECGNCTNRTAHILTRVTNLTPDTLSDIDYIEIIDFDVDGNASGDIFDHTNESVTARDTNGIMIQSLILRPGFADVDNFNGFGVPAPCNGISSPVGTPTAPGDFEAGMHQNGPLSLGAGSNTGNLFRIHVRRY